VGITTASNRSFLEEEDETIEELSPSSESRISCTRGLRGRPRGRGVGLGVAIGSRQIRRAGSKAARMQGAESEAFVARNLDAEDAKRIPLQPQCCL
jgi:hypothetical protein